MLLINMFLVIDYELAAGLRLKAAASFCRILKGVDFLSRLGEMDLNRPVKTDEEMARDIIRQLEEERNKNIIEAPAAKSVKAGRSIDDIPDYEAENDALDKEFD